MARPRGPPQNGARRMARSSVFRRKTLAQREFASARQFKSFGVPAGRQPCGGGPAVVHLGDDGSVSQMFILHAIPLFAAEPGGTPGFHIRLNIIVCFSLLFKIISHIFCFFHRLFQVIILPAKKYYLFSQRKTRRRSFFWALPPLTLLSRHHYNRVAATEAAPAPHVPRK